MQSTSLRIFLFLIFLTGLSCKEPTPVNLQWKHNPVDAGPVSYGSMKSLQFECTNNGEKPVQIRAVYPGCDCTIIDSFTTKWIQPGHQGVIRLHYDTHKGIIGPLRKNLFVVSDGTLDSVSTLYYTGIVTGTK